MAVKWAVANGNWSAGATWNDGGVPAVGDDVYLNSHTISITSSFSIGSGTISNGVNPETQMGGGMLTLTANINPTIVANFSAASQMFSISGYDVLTIIGNVNSSSTFISVTSNSSTNIIITGNINHSSGTFINKSAASAHTVRLSITGNLTLSQSYLFSENFTSTRTFYAVGNITIDGGGFFSTNAYLDIFLLNGSLSNIYGRNVLAVDAEVSGNITYASTTGGMGIFANSLTINNPDTFTWKDITEPRSNPFIILTDAEMNNRQQYPSEDEVKEGTEYVWGEKVGTYQQPPESVVLKDYVYDNGDKVGALENQNIVGCVTKEDVREGVELIGLQEVGTLVVPSADDVREGVVFDNGSVGTLIVQGGGDRLRIANFGYYTDSQSDTYIVDINDSFKPMFATAEESVLLELFPELDLDNIPDKYFDDLFVKYLKYRLIVEYYRGAGINSVFTPSELTAEVVNYQNVRCEYWLNLANIYLNAWAKKYPNSIKKQRILL